MFHEHVYLTSEIPNYIEIGNHFDFFTHTLNTCSSLFWTFGFRKTQLSAVFGIIAFYKTK